MAAPPGPSGKRRSGTSSIAGTAWMPSAACTKCAILCAGSSAGFVRPIEFSRQRQMIGGLFQRRQYGVIADLRRQDGCRAQRAGEEHVVDELRLMIRITGG